MGLYGCARIIAESRSASEAVSVLMSMPRRPARACQGLPACNKAPETQNSLCKQLQAMPREPDLEDHMLPSSVGAGSLKVCGGVAG